MRELAVIPAACCAPGAPPLDPATATDLAARFRALGDPARVALINRLAGADAVCVCDLVADSGLAQPTVSHHLKKLKDAGLVTSERRGTWAYYSLVPEALAELAAALGGA